jgi:hypothetical protein
LRGKSESVEERNTSVTKKVGHQEGLITVGANASETEIAEKKVAVRAST